MAFASRTEDLEFDKKVLGKGFFGEVLRATAVHSKQVFAVKKVKLSLISEHKLDAQLQREIQILYSVEHPRIVRLFFDFKDSRFMYLGLEFCSGGTLFDKLNQCRKFAPAVASKYFWETCDALDYLHHQTEKVIHRDIKPENILLDGEDHVKLADFGWANLLEGKARETFCGTLDYLAPEMIQGTGHKESVDMWSMGVLLYELITGQSPFGSTTKETTCRLILNVDLRFPTEIDSDAKDLISRLCKLQPKERLTVREALAHLFVTSHQSGNVAARAEAEEEDVSRPSVVVRGLRKEQEKIGAEMAHLLQAKQRTEDAFMRVNQEMDATHSALQKEKAERKKLDAACAELRRANEAREAEIERERKKFANLQSEKAKFTRTR